MSEENDTTESPEGFTEDEDLEGHLPEWIKIFGKLKKEAEKLYPDGRIKIIVPKRAKRKRH